jgi:hypothetical protein
MESSDSVLRLKANSSPPSSFLVLFVKRIGTCPLFNKVKKARKADFKNIESKVKLSEIYKNSKE